MNSSYIRKSIKKWIPVGSPLWYPYFLSKRYIKSFRKEPLLQRGLQHVMHQNIVLDKYKAIYIPIPKAACSTLKSICADLLGMETPTNDVAEEIHLMDFPAAKKYKIHKKYVDYFKFAIVRNPWSRLVSCFNDKINYERGHVYERYENTFIEYLKKMKAFSEDMTFERFVEVICDIPDEYAEAHFRSQYLFLTDERGNFLPDFVGKFEELDVAFETISNKLSVNIPLPHIRQGKKRNYFSYYNNKTSKYVERRYERDIKMFGYLY